MSIINYQLTPLPSPAPHQPSHAKPRWQSPTQTKKRHLDRQRNHVIISLILIGCPFHLVEVKPRLWRGFFYCLNSITVLGLLRVELGKGPTKPPTQPSQPNPTQPPRPARAGAIPCATPLDEPRANRTLIRFGGVRFFSRSSR